MNRRLAVASLLTLAPTFAYAGKIAIVTDEAGGRSAANLQNAIRSACPFSQMKELVIEVKVVTSDQLGTCGGLSNAVRVLACPGAIQRYSAEMNAERVVVLKDSPQYGGSGDPGNKGATATTSSGPRVALHELLHSFGFKDEYEFQTPQEADLFCDPRYSGENVAYFPVYPPYRGDADARARHSRDIPWLGRIKQSTPIVTGTELGTPIPKQIGLYPGSMCAKADNKIKAWRPGDDTTPNIMQDVSAKIPPTFFESIFRELRESPPPDIANCDDGTSASAPRRGPPLVPAPPRSGPSRGQRGVR
jgi:hypothetical protein